MRQAKKRVVRASVPAGMVGKRDGLFFLWGQIERARLNLENTVPPDGTVPDGSGMNRNGSKNRTVQAPVDEFIFY